MSWFWICRPSAINYSIILVLSIIICQFQEVECAGTCNKLYKFPESKVFDNSDPKKLRETWMNRKVFTFDQLMKDAEEAEKNPNYTPSFIADYRRCAIPGDQDPKNARKLKDYVADFLLNLLLSQCNPPGPSPVEQEACKVMRGAYLNALAANTQIQVRNTLCRDVILKYFGGLLGYPDGMPQDLFDKLYKRDIFPEEQPISLDGNHSPKPSKDEIMKRKNLEELVEYLVDPDFDWNVCRTVVEKGFSSFPVCSHVKSCGYMTAIDFVPPALIRFIRTACRHLLQYEPLTQDPVLYHQFQLAELRKDCVDETFIKSFKCLSVNVTLRRKVRLYANFVRDNRKNVLKTHIDKLIRTFKMEAIDLFEDISIRTGVNIATRKIGQDCTGTIDYDDILRRFDKFINSPVDGSLPFDLIKRFPWEEEELVKHLSQQCDLATDLVCGSNCKCQCPNEDKWRVCNDVGKGKAFSLITMLIAVVHIWLIV